MVTLEPITEKNFREIIDMKLSPEQNKFVAPNVVSLAQAWLYYEDARPFAVCSDGETVGFMMLDWDEGERSVGVWRFMIAPEEQHKGYGRSAMEAAITLVKKADEIDMMYLDYVPGNTVARDLYRSVGFRENGDVSDGEIVMTLPLTDTPRLGCLTADSDDIEDFTELLKAEQESGREVPKKLLDSAYLEKAADDGRITRFTLMGESIGLAVDGELFLAAEYLRFYDEAKTRVGM